MLRTDWRDFLESFMGRCFTEPDSSSQIREYVKMGLQTTADVITATADAPVFVRDEIWISRRPCPAPRS